ncbi:MAG: hypothetical protein BMS9Abin06_0488 [Gammaproteobacteria bacterium]|nr:MAG: hypothetical protein BMS9Abin06_0488 [Gammaproteobacteria bacterium]
MAARSKVKPWTPGDIAAYLNTNPLSCGSAGTYSILQPELAERLRSCKLESLQEKRPELIATANIGCLLHLQQEADVPVRHWIELLASA